jgi:hypothetical protein
MFYNIFLFLLLLLVVARDYSEWNLAEAFAFGAADCSGSKKQISFSASRNKNSNNCYEYRGCHGWTSSSRIMATTTNGNIGSSKVLGSQSPAITTASTPTSATSSTTTCTADSELKRRRRRRRKNKSGH